MRNIQSILWLAALAVVPACGLGTDGTDDDTGTTDETGEDTDTDDTDEDTDETDIVDVTPEWNTGAWTTGWEDAIDCGTSGQVTISAETNNWGYDAALYISQTTFYGAFAAWDELHTLTEASRSSANDGDGFSVFERELETGVSTGSQTADDSTIFKCADPGSLNPASGDFQVTFALAVWGEDDDASMDAPTDCIIFGQDPQELLDDGYMGGTGDGANRSLPDWFNETNCRIVE